MTFYSGWVYGKSAVVAAAAAAANKTITTHFWGINTPSLAWLKTKLRNVGQGKKLVVVCACIVLNGFLMMLFFQPHFHVNIITSWALQY